jgi:hypothetical protein
MSRLYKPVLSVASGRAQPHGIFIGTAGALLRFSHAALHRQPLVVAFQWKTFLVESGGGAVDVTGAGGQEHRQPLRRARVGVVDLRKLARHTELRHVWGEADAEGDSNTDEDERGEARRDLLRLWVEKRKFRGGGAG